MQQLNRRVLVLALAAGACSPKPATAPQTTSGPDPAAVIAPIYQPYLASGVLTGLADQAPWSPEMRDALVAMMARSQASGEPILDFDPIIGAQDYQISALSLTTEALTEGSHAVVRAHFKNFDRDTEVVYDMVWRDRWLVDNVRGDGWDLRQIATSG